MAGKAQVLASPRLAYALDKLSKNALADLVVDLILGGIGENAPEARVIAELQSHVNAVGRLRNDRPVSLETEAARHDYYQEVYRKRNATTTTPVEIA